MTGSRRIAQLFSLIAGLTLALCFSSGLGLSQEPGGSSSVYLPLAMVAPNAIYGRVTYSGTAASGVVLDLRFYNGSDWSTRMTTTTNYTGNYLFQNVPGLAANQKYLVRYLNVSDQSRLGIWETRHLTGLSSGNNIDLGSFDVADIALNSPIYGYETSLPRLFTWIPRPATPSDSYRFNLFDSYDYNPKNASSPLGHTDRYTLNSLPPGFNFCNPYYWAVTVDSPDGGWGGSLWAYEVTFYAAPSPSGIYGCVTEGGVPASGVEVDLWRLNLSPPADEKLLTTITNPNGIFSFSTQPPTGDNQYYYVRYENNAVASRLAWYETNLTDYQAGSSVHIGDFDIADIALIAPGDGGTITLPGTFEWTPRPETATDDYRLYLSGAGGSPEHTSPSRGYADQYTLAALPVGFSTDITYTWQVLVSDPFGGGGASYSPYDVTFSAAGLGALPREPQEAAGPPPMGSLLERLRQARLESGDLDRPHRPPRRHPDYERLLGK